MSRHLCCCLLVMNKRLFDQSGLVIAGLCQVLLHLKLDKTNAVRCSNWETRPLSAVQKAYAATDAYAALALYQVCDIHAIMHWFFLCSFNRSFARSFKESATGTHQVHAVLVLMLHMQVAFTPCHCVWPCCIIRDRTKYACAMPLLL